MLSYVALESLSLGATLRLESELGLFLCAIELLW